MYIATQYIEHRLILFMDRYLINQVLLNVKMIPIHSNIKFKNKVKYLISSMHMYYVRFH